MIQGFGNIPVFEYDENGNPIKQVGTKGENVYNKYEKFLKRQKALEKQRLSKVEEERLKRLEKRKLESEGKYSYPTPEEIEVNTPLSVLYGALQGPADVSYYALMGADSIKDKITGEGFLSEEQKEVAKSIKNNPYKEVLGERFNQEYNQHKTLNPTAFKVGEIAGFGGVGGGAKLGAKALSQVGRRLKGGYSVPTKEILKGAGRGLAVGSLFEGAVEPAMDYYLEEKKKKKKTTNEDYQDE